MKAIVYRDYGSPDVLRLEDIEKPAPADDEVLIQVRAAAANPLDWRMMRGLPYPLRVVLRMNQQKVKRPGVDVAGVVEAVGKNVTRFKPGDPVFGVCRGAFAEYGCAPESKLARKPANLTFEQAASAPVAALTALQGLRDHGHLQPGQKVLVNGAAGGVGTFTVQVAKSLGAHVTGVCSTRNVELVRSLGADRVIDYTQEDFTLGSRRYDLIFDNIGNHSLSACRRVMVRNGICVIAGGKGVGTILVRMVTARMVSWFVSRKSLFFIAKVSPSDLAALGELMAAGKITPVIDRRYRLHQVPDAIRYLEEGHARGKVLITMDGAEQK